MKTNNIVTRTIILSFIIICGQARGQEMHTLKPVSDEAYHAILQFYQYDKAIPLNAETIEKEKGEGYVREKIIFEGHNGSRVVGYLAIPTTGNSPYPCVLEVHGLGVSKDDFWSKMYHHGDIVTDSLLSLQYAVLALDLPYHGDRSYEGDFISPIKMLFENAWGYRIRDIVINSSIEYRRAIDYLESREDIDQDKLGVVGYSLGSVVSAILTGVDDRIDASVICSPAIIKPRPFFPPEESLSGFAPQTFLRTYNNRPALILAAKNDDFNCTVNEAKQLFELISGDSKEIMFFESGHSLPPKHSTEVVDWFAKYLK